MLLDRRQFKQVTIDFGLWSALVLDLSHQMKFWKAHYQNLASPEGVKTSCQDFFSSQI